MPDKLQQLFAEACELDPAKRASFLDETCIDDHALRQEVESLLAAHDQASRFMQDPTSEFVASARVSSPLPEEPGAMIGRYKLLECIGEGGFGVVYMAQQSEPIRRRLALKIIKLGMDTKQVVARFEAERQALAMMDHPNIARVIDGGATDSGRPYFVMELVRGDPITAYCDRERLPTRERLELFQQVCHAVQHAHQKGIIHRDIKPSNVLVTKTDDRPLVKVIDFGIAKATNHELTEKTLFTEFRQLIGTPQYMSPEQAERSGVDIDTRSDIYSLGVLLYEMLIGRTPLDPKKLGSAAWNELQRIICEEEPAKPSTLVSAVNADTADVAKRRSIEPSRLGMLLKGDLDWIVLKSLEKDRSRRYATASELADDIGRYLCDEPVRATPPSAAYRLSKFARRDRRLLAAASGILAALLLGLAATSMTAAWAVKERQRALANLQLAHRANEQAEQAASKARRSAIIAGGSILLPDDEARALAEQWKSDLQRQRQAPADAVELVKEETHFATWYGQWLLHHGRPEEAIQLVADYYPQAKGALGSGDASFLNLCNTYAQAHIVGGSPPQMLVPVYEDLLPAMEAIHGVASATVLLPEFAGLAAQAGKGEQALEAITTYLARRREVKTDPGPTELAKLDVALDKLVAWGERHPKVYQQLNDFRETGVVSGGGDDVPEDTELANDLKLLQGRWEWKSIVRGEVVEHMTQEFSGSNTTTKWVKKDGTTERGRSGRFVLSRSGGAKVLTSYLGSRPQSGVSFIYKIEKGRFTIVSGMLDNRNSLPETRMRVWRRIE